MKSAVAGSRKLTELRRAWQTTHAGAGPFRLFVRRSKPSRECRSVRARTRDDLVGGINDEQFTLAWWPFQLRAALPWGRGFHRSEGLILVRALDERLARGRTPRSASCRRT